MKLKDNIIKAWSLDCPISSLLLLPDMVTIVIVKRKIEIKIASFPSGLMTYMLESLRFIVDHNFIRTLTCIENRKKTFSSPCVLTELVIDHRHSEDDKITATISGRLLLKLEEDE